MGDCVWSAIEAFVRVGGWLVWSAIPVLVGWFVYNFLAKPYLEFRHLKTQAHEAVILTDLRQLEPARSVQGIDMIAGDGHLALKCSATSRAISVDFVRA